MIESGGVGGHGQPGARLPERSGEPSGPKDPAGRTPHELGGVGGHGPHLLIEIVGILDDGPESLTLKALRIVEQAEVLVGGVRHLEFFPDHPAEKWPIKGSLGALAERIGAERRRVVVLASGDPNFYGIAGFLAGRLGRERIRIHPNVSAMALAFARARVPWDGAVLHSVHGRGMDGLAELVRGAAKVGLFTDEKNSPDAIGRLLLAAGVTGYRAWVCENLGGERERVVETDIAGLAAERWAPLNVLILVREEVPDGSA